MRKGVKLHSRNMRTETQHTQRAHMCMRNLLLVDFIKGPCVCHALGVELRDQDREEERKEGQQQW